MLDLDHPLTPRIFRASYLLDESLRLAGLMARDGGDASERASLWQECAAVLEELWRLNAEAFGASEDNARTLDALRNALAALLAGQPGAVEDFHRAREALEQRFGTWLI